MNLRFSPKQIRFRINNTELDTLLKTKSLEEIISLPNNQIFKYQITVHDTQDDSLEYDKFLLHLSLPFSKVMQFSKTLPSKKGLSIQYDVNNKEPIEIIFEVDVRKSVRSSQ